MNARTAAARIRSELVAAGIPDAAMEAEVLTRHASGLSRSEYFADKPVDEEAWTQLVALVKRRLLREPTPYLTGIREFHGLEFIVGKGALIPRPETELLVEVGLSELKEDPFATVLDMGTGCGAIAIAIAKEAPRARILATDISSDALRIASLNVARHTTPIELIRADLARGITRADIILANLPYVPEGIIETLQPEVRQWEPRVALNGGEDGLDLLRALIDDCQIRLRPRLVAFEVGLGQARKLVEIIDSVGAKAEIVNDLVGWERVVTARWQ